jgi:hypothetical protein
MSTSRLAIFVLFCLVIASVLFWSPTPTMKSQQMKTSRISQSSSHPDLDSMAKSSPTRLKMFVTYHNSIGEQAIRQFSRNYTRKWVRPVLCNATKYFEYYAYKELSKLSQESDLKGIDYVIMTGYKTITKEVFAGQMVGNSVYLTEDLELKTLLEYAGNHPEYDFIPFFVNSGLRSVAERLPRTHGLKAIPALTSTLKAMNWTNREIKESLSTFEFFRNSFLVKSLVFLELAKAMATFIDTIESSPTIGQLYQHNAGYGAAKLDVALKTFGTPYYQLHCFVAERMPTVFLKHLGANPPMALLPKIAKKAKRESPIFSLFDKWAKHQ